MKIKTIGILTSGGDAPGMNAAIRATARTALHNGLYVKGIMGGYNGLMNGKIVDLAYRDVSGTLQRGGTILHSARCEAFKEEQGVEAAAQICEKSGIDALIVIGGDGSYRGALALSQKGVPCIGIPGTIDNDIASTEYTIGFDTALNTVVQNVDKLRDTSESHNRCSVVEVMGRRRGDIALYAAIACGAEYVFIPERQYTLERDVYPVILKSFTGGKTHCILIVTEGVCMNNFGHNMTTEAFAGAIEEATGIETRATVIGHVQRGGAPTMWDRVVASSMGNYAVNLLLEGKSNRVVAMCRGEIVDYDITQALMMEKRDNSGLIQLFTQVT